MAENSHIEWTTHTFNPWIGCSRVSPGCQHCYAETLNSRMGWTQWGPKGERTRTSDANWRKPLAWNKAAAKSGERTFVFCASLADVFDEHPSIPWSWRNDLWNLIADTPHLTWQLLTKRPENAVEMAPGQMPANVWIGTSVEDQRRADGRIPHLLEIPATVRFLSCEPLLGPIEFSDVTRRSDAVLQLGKKSLAGIHWVIVGGESGPGALPMDLAWARDIVRQCKAADVPAFVKQLGSRPVAPVPGKEETRAVNQPFMGGGWSHFLLRDRKGGDMAEWPADLRVREMPPYEPQVLL